jgi:tetratricopeptide (TPR) repeat protein
MRVTLLTLVLVSGASTFVAQAPGARLQELSEQGQRALAAHQYAEAQRAYEELRKLSPGTGEVHATLGLIYFQQRKYADAVPTLRQAIKLTPSLPNVDLLLAMSLSEVGQHREAVPDLEKGFRRATDPAMKRAAGLRLQRSYTELRRDSEAVAVSLELTRLFPDDPEVLYHGSRLAANLAYITIQKLNRIAPDSIWMHLTAGEVQETQGGYDAAIREYRAVLKLDPTRPGVHFRLGRVLLARASGAAPVNTLADARAEFEEELRLDPTSANAAYEVAEIHRKSGQLEEARTAFELAVKHYPDFEDALVGLGRTLVALGQPDLGLTRLQKAIAIDPNNEVSWYQMAQAHRARGDAAAQQKALAEYQRIREANSGRSDVAVRREVTKQTIDPAPPR